MTSAEIYDAGYAVSMYDIIASKRHWRFRDEEFTLPYNAVPMRSLEGVSFQVGKIEDVRAACQR